MQYITTARSSTLPVASQVQLLVVHYYSQYITTGTQLGTGTRSSKGRILLVLDLVPTQLVRIGTKSSTIDSTVDSIFVQQLYGRRTKTPKTPNRILPVPVHYQQDPTVLQCTSSRYSCTRVRTGYSCTSTCSQVLLCVLQHVPSQRFWQCSTSTGTAVPVPKLRQVPSQRYWYRYLSTIHSQIYVQYKYLARYQLVPVAWYMYSDATQPTVRVLQQCTAASASSV